MSGNGNHCPAHMSGFSVPHYSYFFPHMLGGLSPPALQGLPVSGYSTPSPAKLPGRDPTLPPAHNAPGAARLDPLCPGGPFIGA
ncbi:hypothetical protein ANANG_G00290520 [Anguilla anguilla]|uniref:Uncharacterized protein n=1 Tax=Anguilla anguilla TaxID=7936 RepID=A0A9D3LNP6_ANGAN|nr:hypothetical protein ANANG_G00290520 [Anguilla anguilla]